MAFTFPPSSNQLHLRLSQESEVFSLGGGSIHFRRLWVSLSPPITVETVAFHCDFVWRLGNLDICTSECLEYYLDSLGPSLFPRSTLDVTEIGIRRTYPHSLLRHKRFHSIVTPQGEQG